MLWLTWIFCLPSAIAFDIDAHDAIGQTVASAMDHTAIKGMKRLMAGQDASDVAGWGHQLDDTYPEIARLHFQPYQDPFCGPAESRTAKCENNICLLAAVKHFYGRILKDEGRKIEYPEIDHSKIASGLKYTDADAVKMLINLLGDLHAPLHLGYDSSDMGRKIQVKFRGKEMSLYDFWDKGISETVRQDESSFWLGGWTHVSRIRAEFEADKDLWKKEGAFKMFDKWAAETANLACTAAYRHPGSGKMLAGPDALPSPIEIDESAYQQWRTAWLRQILLAGERTAIVLNDILDASGASKLSEGSKVKTKAEEEAEKQRIEEEKERKERHKKDPAFQAKSSSSYTPNAFQNFLTNLGIAVVVVPCLWWWVNYGPSASAVRDKMLNSLENTEASSSQGPTYTPAVGKRKN